MDRGPEYTVPRKKNSNRNKHMKSCSPSLIIYEL